MDFGVPLLIQSSIVFRVMLLTGALLCGLAVVCELVLPRVPEQRRPVRLGRALGVFLALNAALTLVNYGAVWFWSKTDQRLGFPFTTAYPPFFYGSDLRVFLYRFKFLHQSNFFYPGWDAFQYPGSMALLYQALYLTHHPFRVFLVVGVGGVAALAFLLARRMMHEGVSRLVAYGFVIATLLVSYPFWFEFLQGNMEVFVFFFTALGLLSFLRDERYRAGIFFGIATGLKFFPAVYFGLLFARKQYREIAAGLVAAVCVNVAGLRLISPNLKFAYVGIQAGLEKFRRDYMLQYRVEETSVDHSIFGLLKRLLHAHFAEHMPDRWLTIYLGVAAVTGLTLYFVRIRKMPVLNQIASLTVASVLLPPTSHDYTLMHLYVPMGLLTLLSLRAQREGRRVAGLLPAFLCFAVLFAAEMELIHGGRSLSGQVKCVVLMALFAICLRYPWNDLPGATMGQAAESDVAGREAVPAKALG